MDDLQHNYDHEIIIDQKKVRVYLLLKFLTSFSTALLIAWFLGSIINNLIFVIIVISSSGILSLTLLLINKSELFPASNIQRLILFSQLSFSVLSVVALAINATSLFIVSSITGLMLLFLMDLTSRRGQKGKSSIQYGGLTFISALLMVSFLSMLVLPFLFLAAIKGASALYLLHRSPKGKSVSGIQILRVMLLIFAGFCLVTKISYPDNVITFIFICGEFIEMILYNYDSDISKSITENSLEFQLLEDEKERS